MSLLTSIEAGLERMVEHLSPGILSKEARKALQLEQFRCTDFRSMLAELKDVFPGSHEEMRLNVFPLARNVASDLAAQYIKAPIREFLGVDPAIAEVLRGYYGVFDLFLQEAEQAGALGQAYAVGVFPGPGGPEPMLFLPHQIADVRFATPFDAARGDLSRATLVSLLIPAKAPHDVHNEWAGGGSVWYIRLILTPDKAVMRWPDGTTRGVFDESGANPLGRVPLVGTRRVKPAEDYTWAPCHAEDVRACNVGVNLAMTDLEQLVRETIVPSTWAKGDNAKSMSKGVNKAGKINILPPAVELSQIEGVVQVDPYIKATETTIYYLQSWRKTRPEAFQGSIVTGAARRADAEGFVEERHKQETRCKVLEQDLVRLVVDVANLSPRALRLEVPELRLTYRYVKTAENALQEAQSMAVLLDLALADHRLEVAKAEGVTPEQAETLILDRLKRRRDLLGRVAEGRGERVGIDKLDKSVPSAPTPESS